MEQKCIYELTVRCTAKSCEEDLAVYAVTDIDDEYIYFDGKKIFKEMLMEPVPIKLGDGEIIYRVTFFIKEAAIVWVREVFIKIHEHGTREMYNAIKEEWNKILHPYYDCKWFTGGQKVEEWQKEMKAITERL